MEKPRVEWFDWGLVFGWLLCLVLAAAVVGAVERAARAVVAQTVLALVYTDSAIVAMAVVPILLVIRPVLHTRALIAVLQAGIASSDDGAER